MDLYLWYFPSVSVHSFTSYLSDRPCIQTNFQQLQVTEVFHNCLEHAARFRVGETTTLCLSCTRINLLLRITLNFASALIARSCVCFAPCACRPLLIPFYALFCQQGMSRSACLFLQKALLKALEKCPTGFSRNPWGDLPATWVFFLLWWSANPMTLLISFLIKHISLNLDHLENNEGCCSVLYLFFFLSSVITFSYMLVEQQVEYLISCTASTFW